MDSGLEDNDPLMNENLFEGDIMLPKGVSPRAALRRRVILWPYSTHNLFFVGNGTNYRGLEETRMYGDGTAETFFQARLEENQLVVQM